MKREEKREEEKRKKKKRRREGEEQAKGMETHLDNESYEIWHGSLAL